MILFTSDWHLSQRSSMKEDYRQLIGNAFDWIRSFNPDYVVVAGDIFDSPRQNSDFLNFIADILPDNLYGVLGNHDLPTRDMETSFDRSAVKTLIYMKKFTLLNTKPIYLHDFPVYGLSYGEQNEFQNIDTKNAILVIHTPVFKKEVPFFMDGFTARDIAKKYGMFRYIVSGDIHSGFLSKTKVGYNVVMNPGGLFYTYKEWHSGEKKYVFLVDENGNVKKKQVPLFGEFQIQDEGSEIDFDIESFVKLINEEVNEEIDFLARIDALIRSKDLDNRVVRVLKTIRGEIC